MSVDISQFLDTFFEESSEGIEIMESELLELDINDPNLESINTIFRAAHSIKGGAGTFGLQEVADFTHLLETLLDEMREEARAPTSEIVELLLRSVDIIKNMLDASRNKLAYDHEQIDGLKVEFQILLSLEDETKQAVVENSESKDGKLKTYTIVFNPHVDMLKTGNDPLRMFSELALLGELNTTVDYDELPSLEDYIGDESYLKWQLSLKTFVDINSVKEIFEWVDDECELSITETQLVSDEAAKENVAKLQAQGSKQEKSAQPTSAVQGTSKVERAPRNAGESSSIRVAIDKVDTLINMVGELVITQSMLGQLGKDFKMSNVDRLKDGLAQLERNTRELQETVMRIRMLPISFAFNRFPRLVHDLSNKLTKKIKLKLSGEQTEIDKTVLEKIVDPLVHLVRNSIDHGIEDPETREAMGKPPEGTITLDAYHKGGNIIIEIKDDGAGLNKERIIAKAIEKGLVPEDAKLSDDEIYKLIFHPGFSTAAEVSDVSGRGVGMDVVKRNIHELSGAIEVKSVPGEGSRFIIRLPLTLAIMDGQLIRVGKETYIVPLVSIIESLQVKKSQVNIISGRAEVYKLRDEYIEVLRLYSAFDIEPDNRTLVDGLLVVVECDGRKVGLLVDDLLDQQQVVIKSLETNFKKVAGISGATILGDGTVAMILDVQGLVVKAHEKKPEMYTGDDSVQLNKVA